MCRHLAYWYFCNHLVHKYEVCPSRTASPESTTESTSKNTSKNTAKHCPNLLPPLTIMPDQICPLCFEPPQNHLLNPLRQNQLTLDSLATILGFTTVPAPLPPDLLQRIAWFFARGDHVRFDQPVPRVVSSSSVDCGCCSTTNPDCSGYYHPLDPVVQAVDADDWAVVYMPGGDVSTTARNCPGSVFDTGLLDIQQLESKARELGLPPLSSELMPAVVDVDSYTSTSSIRVRAPNWTGYHQNRGSHTSSSITTATDVNANQHQIPIQPGIYSPFDDDNLADLLREQNQISSDSPDPHFFIPTDIVSDSSFVIPPSLPPRVDPSQCLQQQQRQQNAYNNTPFAHSGMSSHRSGSGSIPYSLHVRRFLANPIVYARRKMGLGG